MIQQEIMELNSNVWQDFLPFFRIINAWPEILTTTEFLECPLCGEVGEDVVADEGGGDDVDL